METLDNDSFFDLIDKEDEFYVKAFWLLGKNIFRKSFGRTKTEKIMNKYKDKKIFKTRRAKYR